MTRLTPSEMLILLSEDAGSANSLMADLSLLVVMGCASSEQAPGDQCRLRALTPPDASTWPPHLQGLHTALAAGARPLAGGNMGGEIGDALTTALGGNTSTASLFTGGFMPGILLYMIKVRESVESVRGYSAQRPVKKLFGLVDAQEKCRTERSAPFVTAMDRRLEASQLLPRMLREDPAAAVAAACALGTLLITACMSQQFGPKLGQVLISLSDAARAYPAPPPAPCSFAPQAGEELWLEEGAYSLPPEGVVAMVAALISVVQLNINLRPAAPYAGLAALSR